MLGARESVEVVPDGTAQVRRAGFSAGCEAAELYFRPIRDGTGLAVCLGKACASAGAGVACGDRKQHSPVDFGVAGAEI